MKTKTWTKRWTVAAVGAGAAATLLAAGINGAETGGGEEAGAQEAAPPEQAGKQKKAKAGRPKPKKLSQPVRRGLEYLAATQHDDGGWGQGGGWRSGGSQGGRVEDAPDPSDIGNTSVALLTFLRAGHRFDKGKYQKTMTAGIDFLLTEIAKNEDDSLFVTDVRNTQLQSKIGAYIDTFLAALVLSELEGKLPDVAMEGQRAELLARVVRKIEKNQRADGTFDGNAGWAAVLSQGVASKALNRAWAAGAPVSNDALTRDQAGNAQGVSAGSTTIAATEAEPSSAGVDIYRYSAKLGGLQELAINEKKRRDEFDEVLKSDDATDEAKEEARRAIEVLDKNAAESEAAFGAVKAQLSQKGFVEGFGNNGGEEFLSYMNLSEAICARGGQDWQDWDAKVSKMVSAAQNEDGSWAGHHCITGRTFCTSTALLTLMADRAPVHADAGGEEVAKAETANGER